MGARIPLTAAVLAIGLGLAGCSAGERPPLWTLYDDPTAQAPPVDGNAIVYDRRIEAYTWPDVSMRLGGFTGLYDPYLYPGRYGWYGGPPGWGRPPYIWRNPTTQRSFGNRPAVPGPQTLPPAPAPPTLAPRPAAPLSRTSGSSAGRYNSGGSAGCGSASVGLIHSCAAADARPVGRPLAGRRCLPGGARRSAAT